jgi:hypothetical protein
MPSAQLPSGPAVVPVAAINPEANYALKLRKPVKWDTIDLLPLHDHVVSGRVLTAIMEENPDAVDASAAV